jgi:hypothetical protein
MITQGTDGLSRGLTSQGVMTGLPSLEFVSLHCNALERQGHTLLDWALSLFSGADQPIILKPEDWFIQWHKYSTCIWASPPTVADVALEQMAFSIHKSPKHIHLILIPCLLASRWRKFLPSLLQFFLDQIFGATHTLSR